MCRRPVAGNIDMNIWHLVLISADVDPDAVRQVAADLDAARSACEMAFDSLAIGLRVAPSVGDGLLGGRLNTGSGGGHVLLVRLADQAALETYYAAPAHSIIRRRFLSRASGACARLYDQADAEADCSNVIFDEIEKIAADILKRIDILV